MIFLIPPTDLAPIDGQRIVNVRAYDPPASRLYVKVWVKNLNWNNDEWVCLDELVNRESEWNMSANNPNSSAFGLFQVLKTPEDSTIEEQVKAGIKYLDSRYDSSACKALRHHDRKNWY
jgi:hypothetical protein